MSEHRRDHDNPKCACGGCIGWDEAMASREWISAKDRLPESKPNEEFFGKAVLVCMRGRDDGEYEWNRGHRVYGMATIVPNTGEWKHWYVAGREHGETAFLNRSYRITHWMQLPELPEEKP